MIKLLFSIFSLSIVTILVTLFQSDLVIVDNFQHWSDLNITSQIQLITGVMVMALTVIIATVIFKSVWIRKGYEGLDEKLEAKEVATMLSHVIAFFLLLVFEYMIIFNPYMKSKFPDYAYWICATGFIGPEVYLLINFFKQLKDPKQNGH